MTTVRKRTTHRAAGAVLMMTGFFIMPAAWAQLTIEITSGVEQAVPIAVVPFEWDGAISQAPMDVSTVITSDLASSGRFDPMPVSEMLEKPTEGTQIDFDDWRLLGVDVIVVGKTIAQGGDRFVIQFEVYDVLNHKRLLGFRLPGSGNALREAAHRISDLIYEKLTGVKGAFATKIAFISVEGRGAAKKFRLIVADADGVNDSVIVESPEPIMSPTWSPDGRRIAYVSFESTESAVYVQELDTGRRQKVSARRGVNSAPSFSPDGRKLALTLSRDEGNLDIYVLNLDNQVLDRITRNPAIDTEATWSEDGQKLFFTSDRSGGPQIYVADLDDKRARRVTFEGNYNARPRLTPDNSEMAVVHNDQGNYRIARVDPSNGNTLVLSNGRLDESPSFAPNGETIIYATRDRGRGVLATVSIDGRIQRRLAAQAGDVREPAWSPFTN